MRFWLTADSLGFGNPLGLNRDYRVGPVNRRELHDYDYRSPGRRMLVSTKFTKFGGPDMTLNASKGFQFTD